MNRLWIQLSIAFGVSILLSIVLIVLTILYVDRDTDIQSILVSSFNTPDGLIDTLADNYRRSGNWNRFVRQLRVMNSGTLPTNPPMLDLTLADEAGTILYSDDESLIGTSLQALTAINIVPIEVDNRVRGYLEVDILDEVALQASLQSFVFERFVNAVIVATIISSILGLVCGVLASRLLTNPLNKLAENARNIQDGGNSQRLATVGAKEIQDVTHVINEMLERVQESERLRQHLVQDVAHELRTPLSVLQSHLYALLEGVYPLDHHQIAQLYDKTRLLSRLVNDLHELSQAEAKTLSLNLQPFSIDDLLHDVADVFKQFSQEKNITLTTSIADNLPSINGDEERIRQVLHNLLSNALRYTSEHGKIQLIAVYDDNQIIIRVIDNGIGIDSEHLNYIFERFYRVDSSRNRKQGGTGLGLAISMAIIQLHEGELLADSAGLGKGSEFTVILKAIVH